MGDTHNEPKGSAPCGPAQGRRRGSGHECQVALSLHLSRRHVFKAKGTPYAIVIDKKGEIVARIPGRSGDARLARVLDPLVKELAKRKPPACCNPQTR